MIHDYDIIDLRSAVKRAEEQVDKLQKMLEEAEFMNEFQAHDFDVYGDFEGSLGAPLSRGGRNLIESTGHKIKINAVNRLIKYTITRSGI